MPDLSTTLADVRRAYRLIWGYQRRIMDLVQVFEDEFPSHEFYAWSPLAFARPTQLTTSPIRKWAWDGLPFYKVSFLYTQTGSSPHEHKAGEWMFEMSIDTDDVNLSEHRGEPDAANFPDAGSTRTTLKLVAWKCTEVAAFNWFHDLWSRTQWPPTDNELFQQSDYPVQCLSITTEVQDLPDRAAALDLIARFKKSIATELQLPST